jgi:hypothetical protein
VTTNKTSLAETILFPDGKSQFLALPEEAHLLLHLLLLLLDLVQVLLLEVGRQLLHHPPMLHQLQRFRSALGVPTSGPSYH